MNFHWERLGGEKGETDGGKGRAAESQQNSQRRPRRQPDGVGKEKADADYTLGTYRRARNTMDEAAGGREQETDENAGEEETRENNKRRGRHKTQTTNTTQNTATTNTPNERDKNPTKTKTTTKTSTTTNEQGTARTKEQARGTAGKKQKTRQGPSTNEGRTKETREGALNVNPPQKSQPGACAIHTLSPRMLRHWFTVDTIRRGRIP